MTDESKFIPGIYNYCDRWCERCPMTSRCRVYAEERGAEATDPAASDPRNAAFWEVIAANVHKARVALEQMAAERGIDVSELLADSREEMERDETRRRRAREEGPSGDAFEYASIVNAWFNAHPALFRERGDELVGLAKMDIPGADPLGQAQKISDALEVIRWYQLQIHVKLSRALMGEDDPDMQDDDGTPAPRDSDGSAKVALLGIERSTGAWARLHELFPDQGDSILDMLVRLDRLRRGVEARFPNARAFKRPGFDD